MPARSVLIVKPKWLAKIMSGEKTVEIRGEPSIEHEGSRIYLAPSRNARILCSVFFERCQGPLTMEEFVSRRPMHCVDDTQRPYGARTHAWHFRDVISCQDNRAYGYHRKAGVVKWEDVALAKELRHA